MGKFQANVKMKLENADLPMPRSLGPLAYQMTEVIFLENMKELLKSNPSVELYRVPRVNIVRGATVQDAMQWGWNLGIIPEYFGDLPIVNWNHGDYQSRIYKNSLKIQWHKPLHETISGAEYVSQLPKEVEWSIIHDKTIQRQQAQNMFYNQNWSKQANMGHG